LARPDAIQADIVIIGGGLVGCATAYRLAQDHGVGRIVILEKEATLSAHQSGRNSGVIHSGIYYRPGSAKAENCLSGRSQLIEFCEAETIPFDLCGKVIVATQEDEIPRLREIQERGIANGVESQRLTRMQLSAIEPHATGLEALFVPSAGIVDFRAVCGRLGDVVERTGHRIIRGARVQKIQLNSNNISVETDDIVVHARLAVNCGGLYSDRIARMAGQSVQFQIIPFRGVYYELLPHARDLCKNLIYPVPDPAFPFLGVHFTRTIDGRIECGPNAVLATGREAYSIKSSSVSEVVEILGYSGFRHLARKHWRKGLDEMVRTVSSRRYVRQLQRLIPSLRDKDVVKTRSGIRAQAINPEGDLIEDFMIEESERMVSVCNAPSPAATACLRIGERIARQAMQKMN
jgi:L-2-hydroxyglutarate oxidase